MRHRQKRIRNDVRDGVQDPNYVNISCYCPPLDNRQVYHKNGITLPTGQLSAALRRHKGE